MKIRFKLVYPILTILECILIGGIPLIIMGIITSNQIEKIGEDWARGIASSLASATLNLYTTWETATLQTSNLLKSQNLSLPHEMYENEGRNWTDYVVPALMSKASKFNFSFSAVSIGFEDYFFAFQAFSMELNDTMMVEWAENFPQVASDSAVTVGGFRYSLENFTRLPDYSPKEFFMTDVEVLQRFPRDLDKALSLKQTDPLVPACNQLGPLHTWLPFTGVYWEKYIHCQLLNGTGHRIGHINLVLAIERDLARIISQSARSANGQNFIVDELGFLLGTTIEDVPIYTSTVNPSGAIGKLQPGCSSTTTLLPKLTPSRIGCRFNISSYPYDPLRALSYSFATTPTSDFDFVVTNGRRYAATSLRIKTPITGIIHNIIAIIPEEDLKLDQVGYFIGLSTGLSLLVAILGSVIAIAFFSVAMKSVDEVREKLFRTAMLQTLDADDDLVATDDRRRARKLRKKLLRRLRRQANEDSNEKKTSGESSNQKTSDDDSSSSSGSDSGNGSDSDSMSDDDEDNANNKHRHRQPSLVQLHRQHKRNKKNNTKRFINSSTANNSSVNSSSVFNSSTNTHNNNNTNNLPTSATGTNSMLTSINSSDGSGSGNDSNFDEEGNTSPENDLDLIEGYDDDDDGDDVDSPRHNTTASSPTNSSSSIQMMSRRKQRRINKAMAKTKMMNHVNTRDAMNNNNNNKEDDDDESDEDLVGRYGTVFSAFHEVMAEKMRQHHHSTTSKNITGGGASSEAAIGSAGVSVGGESSGGGHLLSSTDNHHHGPSSLEITKSNEINNTADDGKSKLQKDENNKLQKESLSDCHHQSLVADADSKNHHNQEEVKTTTVSSQNENNNNNNNNHNHNHNHNNTADTTPCLPHQVQDEENIDTNNNNNNNNNNVNKRNRAADESDDSPPSSTSSRKAVYGQPIKPSSAPLSLQQQRQQKHHHPSIEENTTTTSHSKPEINKEQQQQQQASTTTAAAAAAEEKRQKKLAKAAEEAKFKKEKQQEEEKKQKESRSMFTEVASLQDSLSELQRNITNFTRYVPKAVVRDLIYQNTHLAKVNKDDHVPVNAAIRQAAMRKRHSHRSSSLSSSSSSRRNSLLNADPFRSFENVTILHVEFEGVSDMWSKFIAAENDTAFKEKLEEKAKRRMASNIAKSMNGSSNSGNNSGGSANSNSTNTAPGSGSINTTNINTSVNATDLANGEATTSSNNSGGVSIDIVNNNYTNTNTEDHQKEKNNTTTASSAEQQQRLLTQGVQDVMHVLFQRINRLIMGHGGVVDKIQADSVVGTWGAPMETEYHALLAVLCALAIRRECNRDPLKSLFSGLLRHKLRARIGISSGQAYVGSVGNANFQSFQIWGSVPSIAKSLVSFTDFWGTDVLIDGKTFRNRHVQEICHGRLLAYVRFREEADPSYIYEAMSLDEESKHFQFMANSSSKNHRSTKSKQHHHSSSPNTNHRHAKNNNADDDDDQQLENNFATKRRGARGISNNNINDNDDDAVDDLASSGVHSRNNNNHLNNNNDTDDQSNTSGASSNNNDGNSNNINININDDIDSAFTRTAKISEYMEKDEINQEGVSQLLEPGSNKKMRSLLRWHRSRTVEKDASVVRFKEKFNEAVNHCIDCQFSACLSKLELMMNDNILPQVLKSGPAVKHVKKICQVYWNRPVPKQHLFENRFVMLLRGSSAAADPNNNNNNNNNNQQQQENNNKSPVNKNK